MDTSRMGTSNSSCIDTSRIDSSRIDSSRIDTSRIDTSRIDSSRMDTSRICFNAHETMVPNRGWQWDRNAFSVISRIQPRFQAVVPAYSGSVYSHDVGWQIHINKRITIILHYFFFHYPTKRWNFEVAPQHSDFDVIYKSPIDKLTSLMFTVT